MRKSDACFSHQILRFDFVVIDEKKPKIIYNNNICRRIAEHIMNISEIKIPQKEAKQIRKANFAFGQT